MEQFTNAAKRAAIIIEESSSSLSQSHDSPGEKNIAAVIDEETGLREFIDAAEAVLKRIDSDIETGKRLAAEENALRVALRKVHAPVPIVPGLTW